MNEYHTCPVCGYNKLIEPPSDYMICPSCGTEFGYDDFSTDRRELRRSWLEEGAKWFSPVTQKPSQLSILDQLRNIPGYEPSDEEKQLIARATPSEESITTVRVPGNISEHARESAGRRVTWVRVVGKPILMPAKAA